MSATVTTQPAVRLASAAEAPTSDACPSQAAVQKCASLPVLDVEGKSRRFDSLYADPGRRTLVIFVRHFFCGMCQNFLRTLCATLSPDDLAKAPRPTSIAVIGCGEPWLIRDYVEHTNCPFPVYTDPTRKLYDAFDMLSTSSMGDKKPDYPGSDTWSVITSSLAQVLGAGIWPIFRAGKLNQVGGDFLFEGGKVTWCHRMQNTRDHTDIPALRTLLEV